MAENDNGNELDAKLRDAIAERRKVLGMDLRDRTKQAMSDADLLRDLRRLVDPAGGGIGVLPEAVFRYVLENVEAARHETEMHDVYQKHARANGWNVCTKCCQRFDWPHGAGWFVMDGGKARATCQSCYPRQLEQHLQHAPDAGTLHDRMSALAASDAAFMAVYEALAADGACAHPGTAEQRRIKDEWYAGKHGSRPDLEGFIRARGTPREREG